MTKQKESLFETKEKYKIDLEEMALFERLLNKEMTLFEYWEFK